MYINQKYLNSINWVMLEIKLPREIFKSPYATETAITSLLQGGGVADWYARNFKGKLPIFSSLEIASIEGVVHFYVRIEKRFRPLVEANFYAQYPGIEIVEADDYTKLIHYHHLTEDVSLWGVTYSLSQTWEPIDEDTGEKYPDPKDKEKKYKMPGDFFPIKTYNDYGLEKDPKEEFKIDPITPLLEMMGSIGKGEHLWYQIILQDEGVYNDKKFPKFYVNEMNHKHMSLSDMVKNYKKSIRIASTKKKGEVALDAEGNPKTKSSGKDADGNPIMVPVTYGTHKIEYKDEMKLTQDEKDDLEMVNKKLAKPLALAVVRMMYVTKSEKFRADNIQNVLSAVKPFAGRNSFIPPNNTSPYDYPWQNFRNRRTPWRTEEMFEAYVEREGFYPHVPKRESLDSFEDSTFWGSSMKTRKIWRMLYEGFFYPFSHPHADDAITLNVEEIATMWHLPGAVATTPSLPRIDSAKGVAPVNLPQ